MDHIGGISGLKGIRIKRFYDQGYSKYREKKKDGKIVLTTTYLRYAEAAGDKTETSKKMIMSLILEELSLLLAKYSNWVN